MENLLNLLNYYKGEIDDCINEGAGCCYGDITSEKCDCIDAQTLRALKELKSYRDAEEQGLLLRLSIPIDSEVWGIILRMDDFLGSYRTVTRMPFKLDMLDKIGKTVFLTKEEAEQKLAETKGE